MIDLVPARATATDEAALVASALRPASMGPRLAAAFTLGTPRAHLLDAKYEPGAYCTALYEIGQKLVTVVVTLDDNAGMEGGVAVGPSTSAFLFPDDPVMTGLPLVLDATVRSQWLSEALGVELRVSRVELVRYRPAKRATFRLEAFIRLSGGRVARRVLFAKAYHRRSKAEAVFRETGRLAPWVDRCPELTVAAAPAYLPDVPMILQEPLGGTPLETLTDRPGGPRAEAAVTRAAVGLAVLHEAPPVSTRTRPIDSELERFGRRAAAIERVDPEVGAELGRLAAGLVESRPAVTVPPVLVHGDCKPGQFRIQGDRVALLDFDHCGLADPASDVGTFLATLRQHELRRGRGRGGNGHAHPLERPFLESYRARAGGTAELSERARWYEAVAFCRKALRAFARSPRSPLPLALAGEGWSVLDRRREAR